MNILPRLEGFYWVAKTGGYARAARAFPYPITQPAVHQQIRKLEAELRVTLFERVAKDRVRPTPAGRTLWRTVAPFLEALPSVLRAVRSGSDAGELVVQAEPMMLRHLLPPWLKRLQARRPGIQVDLREAMQLQLDALRGGEVDLLVGYLPDVPDDVASQQVGRLRPFLVVPEDHPRASRRGLGPRDLRDDPFIAYSTGLVSHDLQLEALALHGVRPPQITYASAADTILAFVASGLGYSLVPHLEPGEPRAAGVAARLLDRPEVVFPVVAAWRRDAPENLALDAALETAPRPPGATT